MAITITEIIGIALMTICFVGTVVCTIGIAKCNINLFYNRHGGMLLEKLSSKNETATAAKSMEMLNAVQIKYDVEYTFDDIVWLLQDATEQEFLDNLPKEPDRQFINLDFSDDKTYRLLHKASQMFGDDCLKYGNKDGDCTGIGISFTHAIHAYASMLKKQNGYYKKYRLLI